MAFPVTPYVPAYSGDVNQRLSDMAAALASKAYVDAALTELRAAYAMRFAALEARVAALEAAP